MDAFGDPTRRAILERLLNGPLPVGKLAEGFPISRPAISQHLKVLEQAGLVVHRTEGTRNLYELDPEGIAQVRSYFDRFWKVTLDAFKKKIEERPN